MDSVFLNGFSLEILSDKFPIEKVIHHEKNYFSLPNGSEYKLRLRNDHNIRVDAHVWINGKKIGIYRINPYSTIVIERSSDLSQKFILSEDIYFDNRTYFDYNNYGLIKIIFKPEKNMNYDAMVYYNNPTNLNKTDLTLYNWNCNNYTDTVTPSDKLNRKCSLKAHNYENSFRPIYGSALRSTFIYKDNINYYNNFNRFTLDNNDLQRFKRTLPLNNIDTNMITTIYARLIVDNDSTMYKRPYIGIKHANLTSSIPPRIDSIGPKHPGRSHKCYKNSPFKLSKKYWFDNLV